MRATPLSLATVGDFSQSDFRNLLLGGTAAPDFSADTSPVKKQFLAFPDVNLSSSSFRNCRIEYANFDGGYFHSNDFSGASIQDCMFRASVFTAATFNKAEITQTRFLDSGISSQFTHSVMRDCEFFGSVLSDADFRDATLDGVSFRYVVMMPPAENFTGAQLREVDFTGAKVIGENWLDKLKDVSRFPAGELAKWTLTRLKSFDSFGMPVFGVSLKGKKLLTQPEIETLRDRLYTP